MESSRPVHKALDLLSQAYEYSKQLGRDAWDFAIHLTELRELGLNTNDLRWLLYSDLVLHAIDVTQPTDEHRVFLPQGKCLLNSQSCFVLNKVHGTAIPPTSPLPATSLPTNGHAQPPRPAPPSPIATPDKPVWEKDRRILRYGPHLVKQFKVRAENQVIILAAFEEEGWPIRIDDPLPVAPDIEPKRRLHDTICSLNRKQRTNLLRFQGDGSGQAVCWEPLA